MPLITPEGRPAGTIERIMLLALWGKKLSEEKHPERPSVILAGMGKPTFPTSLSVTTAGMDYWSKVSPTKARHLLTSSHDKKLFNRIVKMSAAIDYGDPRGDVEPRTKIAKAFNDWYGDVVGIEPDNILFTVGGAGALHCIFSAINKRNPGGIIVTPFPLYSLYTGPQGKNRLFPIPVMKEKGYRLTATSLSKYLDMAQMQAQRDGVKVSALLLCDPNNPLGTALDKEELQKIASLLKNYPDIVIILDEAYAEMRHLGDHKLSLLSVDPELKNRVILVRSATKALSAAGERMAAIVACDETLRGDLLQENVNMYGLAPRSLTYIFAEATASLDYIELENLRNFYRPQVEYVLERLQKMGATMPDKEYQVGGAFYILADLSDLLGQDISAEAARALGKRGRITTDEELIYSLLFDDGVSIAPLSYFGMPNRQGYVRITCSGGEDDLSALMDRLEVRLISARKMQQMQFIQQLKTTCSDLNKINRVAVSAKLWAAAEQALRYQNNPKNINAHTLKQSNLVLKAICADAKRILNALSSREGQSETDAMKIEHHAATTLQAFFRGKLGRKQAKEWKNGMDARWHGCVTTHFSDKETQIAFFQYSPAKRLTFKPWVDFLRKHNGLEEKENATNEASSMIRSKL